VGGKVLLIHKERDGNGSLGMHAAHKVPEHVLECSLPMLPDSLARDSDVFCSCVHAGPYIHHDITRTCAPWAAHVRAYAWVRRSHEDRHVFVGKPSHHWGWWRGAPRDGAGCWTPAPRP